MEVSKDDQVRVESDSLNSTLLSADDVSELLKISKRTLWRLLSRGDVPKPLRFGGNVRWTQEMLDDWVSKGCPKQS